MLPDLTGNPGQVICYCPSPSFCIPAAFTGMALRPAARHALRASHYC